VFIVPFLATQVSAFKATFRFRDEKGDKKAAKNLKMASYPPFMVLLIGFAATTAYNRFTKRRAND
jgi:hypothetical protein